MVVATAAWPITFITANRFFVARYISVNSPRFGNAGHERTDGRARNHKVLPAVPVVLHTLYSSPQVEVEAKKHWDPKNSGEDALWCFGFGDPRIGGQQNREGGGDSTSRRNTSTRSRKSCFTNRSPKLSAQAIAAEVTLESTAPSAGQCHQDGFNKSQSLSFWWPEVLLRISLIWLAYDVWQRTL
jgi:hypothetical protein